MITNYLDEKNIKPTARYSIKETCNLLGIHRNSLLNYTNNGLIKCGFNKNTMHKFYLGMDIVKFWNSKI